MASQRPSQEEQLEFEQAMTDFKRMFPSLDSYVIENVLRNNAGAVDDTIDHLLVLTMTDYGTTSNSSEQTIPKVIDDTPEHPNQLYLKIPANSSSMGQGFINASPNTLSSDAYSALQRDSGRAIRNIPAPDSISPDLLEDFTGNTSYSNETSTRRRNKKTYNPPLIGKLPKDFLRLKNKNGNANNRAEQSFGELDSVYDDLDAKRLRNREAAKARESIVKKKHRNEQKDVMTSTNLGIFRSHTSERPSKKKIYLDTEKESRKLKDLMIENEYRRQLATDPELAQYLADERVAIMLQNREFMRNIRKNKDFLAALDRDAPPPSYKSADSSKSLRRRISSRKLIGDEIPLPDGPIISNDNQTSNIDDSKSTTVFENYHEAYQGYGEEGGTGLMDSFPYTKSIQVDGESDVVFQDRMKNMSKTSKQKFALLARKFLRKSKGAPGLLGTSTDHCSAIGLLESTDDHDDTSPNDNAHGYNQFSDQQYNIGKRTDLKEGRLFSK